MRRFILLAFFAALSFGGELADLSKECKKGNDEICKRLSLAIKNLELACDEGGEKNAMYCAGLGYFYEFDKVFTKAVRYYDKACGLGAEKDYERAVVLFTNACSGASALACANLGFAYEKGMGVEKNKNAAKELYDRGCKLGEFSACQYLKNLR